jgi:hypothetical protein
VHPNPEKTKPERAWKKLEKTSERNPNKTRNPRKNPMETKNPSKKYIYKTRRAPEPDSKPNGFGFQFSPASVGSGVKFKPTSFFAGWVFGQPDPNPTHCHA